VPQATETAATALAPNALAAVPDVPATETAATNVPPDAPAEGPSARDAAPSEPPADPKPAPNGSAANISVPKGSEWTKEELAAVRRDLVAQLDEMRAAYDLSLQDLSDLQQSGTDGAGDDQADAGSKTFEREQEQSIAANRMDLMTQIQRAVERIDAGTYGYCESCGRPIPKARLKAFPMATLDVSCKQREERR
jgi:RNA polymerase-binding protein DksA